MKHIISGTNRPDSNTLKLSHIVHSLFAQNGDKDVEIVDLAQIPMTEVTGQHYYKDQPIAVADAVTKVTKSDGLIMVVPEYNGSMPGILKYFIDHWKYPESFEFRPVAFIGLGGRFGGLRPVEHLQQVFSYRNAFMYPERVFISNVWNTLKDGQLQDPVAMDLLNKQVQGFSHFVKALKAHELDANSRLAKKA